MRRSDASSARSLGAAGCEAHDRRACILDWIGSFDDAVSIIVTSRPGAIQAFREVFGNIGFAARRIMALTSAETATLVRKLARRSGLAEALERALATEVARPDYASLAEVPAMLNLLLHVLAKEGVGAVLSRSQLYDRAVRMMAVLLLCLRHFWHASSFRLIPHLSCQMSFRT